MRQAAPACTCHYWNAPCASNRAETGSAAVPHAHRDHGLPIRLPESFAKNGLALTNMHAVELRSCGKYWCTFKYRNKMGMWQAEPVELASLREELA